MVGGWVEEFADYKAYFVSSNSISYKMRVNVLSCIKWHLHDDAVHVRVLIQLPDLGQEVQMGGGPVQLQAGGCHANLLRCLQLHPDVDIAVFSPSNIELFSVITVIQHN